MTDFAEELEKLIDEAVTAGIDRDEIISALELKLEALEGEKDD